MVKNMSVSSKIVESIEKSSWIRKMFEEGARLKAEFGADNVYDFSLGNPDIDPPAEFFQALKKMAEKGVPYVEKTHTGRLFYAKRVSYN